MFKKHDIVKSQGNFYIDLNGNNISVNKFKVASVDEKSYFVDVISLDDNYNEINQKCYIRIPKNIVSLDIDYYRNKKLNKINNNLKTKNV